MIEILQPFLNSYIYILLIICLFIGFSIYSRKRITFKILMIVLGIIAIGLSITILSNMLGKPKAISLEFRKNEKPEIIRFIVNKKDNYIYYIFKFEGNKELEFYYEVYSEKKAKELLKKGRRVKRVGDKLFYKFSDYNSEFGEQYEIQPQKRALPEKNQGKIDG